MEEFNFEIVFAGSDEGQMRRMTYFLRGGKRLLSALEEVYAVNVMNGNTDSALDAENRIDRIERALEGILSDPRTLALRQRAESENKKRQAEELSKALLRTLA